ncbi:hypothetical protein ACTWPT_30865 [Nonomuraea sp. 3N208]|uniref:hypothetical protein n=1 Tax=Nonomuraea sp. 3N208 TaxID=3457421 RepID=UPI003FD1D560
MDVQGEVLQGGASARHVDLLREVDDRTRRLQAEVAALRTELAAVRAELGEDVAAVQTEVEGVRRAVNARPGTSGDEDADLRLDMLEGFAAVRAEIAHEFGSVRSEMLDLGIKLDRLLNRDGCR